MGLRANPSSTMQTHNLFSHQNAYHQPDWQHHSQAQHQFAQTQAAAAANAAAAQQQQQHYGRTMNGAAGQNGGGNTNGNNAGGLSGMGGVGGGGALGGGASADHGQSIIGPGDSITEDNRRVLEWIAQVLRADTREAALLELSKKREQVPELALILWHSFGKCACHVVASGA